MFKFDLLTNESLSSNGSLYKTVPGLGNVPIHWNKVSPKSILNGNVASETLFCVNRGIVEYLQNPRIRDYYKHIYIWVIESREIDSPLYSLVDCCLDKLRFECKAGFASDSQLLTKAKGFFYPVSIGTVSDSRGDHLTKTSNYIDKPVKLFCSSKIMCLNHKLRLSMGMYLKKKNQNFNFDLVPTSTQSNYPTLRDQLSDCLFCVVIENLVDPYYFTEKIVGCLASKTVPIIYGSCAPEINGLDVRGVLTFNSVNELDLLINICDSHKYRELSNSIEHNYRIACGERYKSLEHQLAFSLTSFGFANALSRIVGHS